MEGESGNKTSDGTNGSQYPQNYHKQHTRQASAHRSVSYTPSYMSAVAGSTSTYPSSAEDVRTPTQSAPIPISSTRPQSSILSRKPVNVRPSGILLVLIATTPHPKIMAYLQAILSEQTFSAIALVGHQSQASTIKQLKMDVYALIGKLRLELGLHTYLNIEPTPDGILGTILSATQDGEIGVQSVLCSPEYNDVTTADVDLLHLDQQILDRSWQPGFAYLQAVMKATVPALSVACKAFAASKKDDLSHRHRGPSFIILASKANSPAAKIVQAACDTLVTLLGQSTKQAGLTVGHAERILQLHTLNAADVDSTENVLLPQEPDRTGESPTKLWNMWQLMDDLQE